MKKTILKLMLVFCLVSLAGMVKAQEFYWKKGASLTYFIDSGSLGGIPYAYDWVIGNVDVKAVNVLANDYSFQVNVKIYNVDNPSQYAINTYSAQADSDGGSMHLYLSSYYNNQGTLPYSNDITYGYEVLSATGENSGLQYDLFDTL
jgi:hypothetical protein